jgi:hypothetical protein
LIAQVIAALDGVEGVVFPGVTPVGKGSVNATLSGVGVASNRMNLAYNCYVSPSLMGGQSGSHSSQACSNYKDIVFQQ